MVQCVNTPAGKSPPSPGGVDSAFGGGAEPAHPCSNTGATGPGPRLAGPDQSPLHRPDGIAPAFVDFLRVTIRGLAPKLRKAASGMATDWDSFAGLRLELAEHADQPWWISHAEADSAQTILQICPGQRPRHTATSYLTTR